MPWVVSMLPVNDYKPEELVQELIPEKYVEDDAGNLVLADICLNSELQVGQLIEFLFQTKSIPQEIYRDAENYILDLSPIRDGLIDFNELESRYPDWLQVTGRENTMTEYGMLIGFVGFGRTGNRRHLIMIASRRLG